MTKNLHYLARKALIDVPLPRPITEYRPGITERLYTHPITGEYSEYPCPLPTDLYQTYANILNTINKKKSNNGNDVITPLTADNIMFTAGSIMGIDLIIRGFCEPNQDSVCVSTPTFNGYIHYAKINQIKIIDTPLQGVLFDRLDIKGILTSQPKLIFLCLPNNPTGSCLNKDDVLSVLNNAENIVVIDEAYIDLAEMPSFTGLLQKYPNLVILKTFSKSWGLAGIRAGAVIASPSIITVLHRIQDPFSVTKPVQLALQKAFKSISTYEDGLKEIKAERESMKEKLKCYSFIEKIYPSNTNFILVKTKNSSTLLNKISNSNCLLDHGPTEIPLSIKISVGSKAEQSKLFSFLDQFKEKVC